MKLAHLILAHVRLPQLERLIKRLQNVDAHIYIHIDKKADIGLFADLEKLQNVFLISNRIKVAWGDYNMVQATLNSFEEILSKKIQYSHINLISSQDYPLKSAAEIQSFLFAHPNKTFMRSFAIPDEWDEPLSRLTKYSFGDYNFPAKHRLQALANKLLPDRKLPLNLKAYGRSQWFTITPACATYVISFLKNNSSVRRYFRMTWAPDEIVFQTVLLNSPFKDTVVNDHLRYIKFIPNDSRPQTLTMAYADTLQSSGKFYARKFDMAIDEQIFDYLDEIAKA